MALRIRDEDVLEYHEKPRPGKCMVVPSKPCLTQRDLSLAYTPGVAVPCLAIAEKPEEAYRYTARATSWRWSRTAPPCSGWATSARSPASR